jgi:hypothetical protein
MASVRAFVRILLSLVKTSCALNSFRISTIQERELA